MNIQETSVLLDGLVENTNEKPLAAKKANPVVIPVMAIAGGVIIANIYYNQPILTEIARSVHATESEIGKISMLSQLGFGLGLFFLLPLGDKVNRKKLIMLLCGMLTMTLCAFAVTTSYNMICALSFLLGLFSVSPQIIMPMAATMTKEDRGKTVGKVFSGILVGILSARVISGLIGDWLGWRYVYVISAVMVLSVSALLQLYLPKINPKFYGSYLGLLKSTLSLVCEFSVLRQAAVLGAFTFGLFCSFWTTLTFHLSGPPLGYSPAKIGLFGIVAIGGALVAPTFGKLADKGGSFRSLLISVSMIIGSVVLMKVFPSSIIGLVVGIFFLDIGVQATQITNFARVYSLHEDAHSRLNTIYMTMYFIGGAAGTFFGLLCWKYGQWAFSTWQMLLWAGIALIIIAGSEFFMNRKK